MLGKRTVIEAASCRARLRSPGPEPRTGKTVYLKRLPRSSVLKPLSHQLNFWKGARSLPLGFAFSAIGTKSSLLNRNCGFLSAPKPGSRSIAKPKKSECWAPSSQSKARKMQGGTGIGGDGNLRHNKTSHEERHRPAGNLGSANQSSGALFLLAHRTPQIPWGTGSCQARRAKDGRRSAPGCPCCDVRAAMSALGCPP